MEHAQFVLRVADEVHFRTRESNLEMPAAGGKEGYDTEMNTDTNSHPAFRLDMACSTSDSLIFRIPEGFLLESLSESWQLQTQAASGMLKWRVDDSSSRPVVMMTSHLSVYQKEFREEDVMQLRSVLQELGRQTRLPLVLVRE